MDILTKVSDMISQYAAGRQPPFAKLDSQMNINAVGTELFKSLNPRQAEQFIGYAEENVVLWDKTRGCEVDPEVTHPIIRLVVMKKIQHTLTMQGENL